MPRFFHGIYNFIFPGTLGLVLFIGRFFNIKLKEGYEGRKQPISFIDKKAGEKVFVFHSSSLGEWEQTIPVLEIIKSKWPHARCFASFFSPSGYKRAKHPYLENKFYLPIDSNKRIQSFLRAISPDYVLFSAYDVWPNLLLNCKKMNIQTGLFSATLPESSLRFKFPLLKWNKFIYEQLDFIGTRSVKDLDRMAHIYSKTAKLFVSGDTRIERVMARKSLAKPIEKVKHFISNSGFVISMGSIWPEDEANVLAGCISFLKTNLASKLIIAPHELHKGYIQHLISAFEKNDLTVDLFDAPISKSNNNRVLILNTIGILAESYQYANVVFVGGSFKKAVHNVLEPAVYNVPVIVGPKYYNSQEAVDLISLGSVFTAHSNADFKQVLQNINNGTIDVQNVAKINTQYFNKNKGASLKILEHLN